MPKRPFFIVLPTLFFLVVISNCALAAEPKKVGRLSDYIRPFVGTQGEGNTYPGPSAPFGMVQLSPDTDKTLWETASGYEYTDKTIMGFSLTHLSGTGIPDLGDFLFMPQIGKPKLVSGSKEKPDAGYRSRYSHDDESASAGYYQVKLARSGVNVELTAGERAGMMRMTFPESDYASILIDLAHVLNGGKWRSSGHTFAWRTARPSPGSSRERLGEGAADLLRGAVFAAFRPGGNLQRRQAGEIQHLSFPQRSRGGGPYLQFSPITRRVRTSRSP